MTDDTYKNPVLNGDFPDSDIEKKGDTFYLITSTAHLSPGMTILESRDLVNWKYTGHAIPNLSWDSRYNWDQMNGYRWGTWAGDLVYHNGEWFCYQIDYQYGLTLTTAPDIQGPWSEPVTLLHRKYCTDPTVYFDDERKEAWLILNGGEEDVSSLGSSGEEKPFSQKLFKLSWDGRRLMDEGTTIFVGNRSEAAKLYRINERWYIMLVEWQGSGKSKDRIQLCLRSLTDSPYGPYESRQVFLRENDHDHSACQGSMFELPNGSWWFMHQLVQNGTPIFQGRAQCLEPVEWKDGWPVIGVDADGDGAGVPVWQYKKPIAEEVPYTLATSDEFDLPVLQSQWNWNHNPRDERWSLTERPGWMRLKASLPVGNPAPQKRFWKAPNTLSQRHLGVTSGSAETLMDCSALKPGTFAGICHFSGRYTLCGVREDTDGKRQLVVSVSGKETVASLPAATRIHLRSKWTADTARFYWSVDGENWASIGPEFKLTFGYWRGDRIGLFCYNTLTDDLLSGGYADFDWFHHNYARK